MSENVYISFGGDTGALEAASAVAKAQVNSLAKEMRELASEMQRTSASADSDLGQKLNSLGGQFACGLRRHLAEQLGKTSERIGDSLARVRRGGCVLALAGGEDIGPRGDFQRVDKAALSEGADEGAGLKRRAARHAGDRREHLLELGLFRHGRAPSS